MRERGRSRKSGREKVRSRKRAERRWDEVRGGEKMR